MKIVLCPACGTGVVAKKHCPHCRHRLRPMSLAVPLVFSIVMMSIGYFAGLQALDREQSVVGSEMFYRLQMFGAQTTTPEAGRQSTESPPYSPQVERAAWLGEY